MHNASRGMILIPMLFVALVAGVLLYVYVPKLNKAPQITIDTGQSEIQVKTVAISDEPTNPEVVIPEATHLMTPIPVKAVYMTACIASMPKMRERIVNLIDTTELNAIVIDIKDYSGTISIATTNPLLKESHGSGCTVKDMRDFIAELHTKNIYVIGRITTFQDPYYATLHPELTVKQKDNGAVWKDRKGLAFIDVGAKPYWDYIVALAQDAHTLGFDEINFDYIRFPSDGDMKNTSFTWSIDKDPTQKKTKAEALKEFFAYLSNAMEMAHITTSADLFGMVTTSHDDMGIGQVLENALPYFDFISPMVYPSHYPPHFNGWNDPNKVPYDIVKFAMDSGVARLKALQAKTATESPVSPYVDRLSSKQLRPWLQDNDYPVTYTPEMVRAQMKATYDAGLDSWMLWDAGNTYTKEALLQE